MNGPRIQFVIVDCPNCDARYRLPEGLNPAGRRMRCAACGETWTIAADAPPDAVADALPAGEPDDRSAPVMAGGETGLEPQAVAAGEAASDAAAEAEPEDEARPGWGGRVLVALVMLVVLGIGVVAAVYAGRLEPGRVPLAGAALARLEPGPSKLVIEARARLTPLPSGAMLLEVDGVVRNTGNVEAGTTLLKATLESPAGVVRRWTIAVPAAKLAPGEEASFQSTLTEVPGAARRLRLVTG